MVALYAFPYVLQEIGLEDRPVYLASELVGAVSGRRLGYRGSPNPRLRGDDPDPAGRRLKDVVANSLVISRQSLRFLPLGTSRRAILPTSAPLIRFQGETQWQIVYRR